MFMLSNYLSSCFYSPTRVEQEMPTVPEHMSSLSVFSGIHIERSFVFCVMFCRSLFVLLLFFLLTIMLSVLSSIYGFWLHLWYLLNSYLIERTDTSIKSGGIKPVFWTQSSPLSEMMWPCKCIPHVTKNANPTHSQANSATAKNAIIPNTLHNTLHINLCMHQNDHHSDYDILDL